MATNSFETRGIVLEEAPFTETSKRLTIFTRERGKISVLAKGVNSPKSSIFSLTQPGIEGAYRFKPGQSFAYIREGVLLKDHSPLRKTYPEIVATSLFLEIVTKSLEDGQKNDRLYDLLAKTLDVLEEGYRTILLNAFLIKALSFLGYRPRFIGKPEENQGKGGFFDPKSGIIEYGMVSGSGKYIQETDILYLKEILYTSLDQLKAARCNEKLLSTLLIQMFYIHLEVRQFHCFDLVASL